MVRKIVIAFALLTVILTPAGANETVTFKGTPHTQNGDFLTLAGQLTKPKGTGHSRRLWFFMVAQG